jgi:hypothetical protein
MNYTQSQSISDLVSAMVNFNLEFQSAGLKKDAKNEHLKNKYLTLDNLLNTVRPILAKNGLIVIQALAGDFLVTGLYHVSGQFIQAEMPFAPMAGNKGTNALQELGGGITYARRYSLSSILGISVDADEDGNNSKVKASELKTQVKKKVNTEEEMYKLVEWLQNNPSRAVDVERYYDLSEEQKKFINDNLNHVSL